MMRKLYLQIYLAFVAVALLCVLAAGVAASALHFSAGPVPTPLRGTAEFVVADLPHGPHLDRALRRRARRLGLDITVWNPDGTLAASAGRPIGRPHRQHRGARGRTHWLRSRDRNGFITQLEDGRVMAVAVDVDPEQRRRHWLVLLAIAGAMGVGCYPVARRITRRLEAVQDGMEAWGGGNLGMRVPEEGNDEVAEVARSFNRAAERIQQLVVAQRRTLASASHDLRSPLTRIRMALELLGDDGADRQRLLDNAARDVDELDALIGDLLLASRLEAVDRTRPEDRVDLGALLAEELARDGQTVDIDACTVRGDAGMLRRLVRNLLDNARKHGGGDVSAWIEPGPVLVVADRGPGVPEALRERIFEPFYRPEGHTETDGGVGLGLSLVRRIAEHHGGTAKVVEREGGGSRFEIRFPPNS